MDFVGTMTWTCDREITLHGFGLWFNTELVPGIGFSNAPAAPRAIYGQAFFPFTNPVNACAGDTIAIDLRATLVGDDYVWAWETHHATASREGRTVTLLRQHSLDAMQLSPNDLLRRSDSFVPTLDDDAHIDQLILSTIDGHKSNGEIARIVQHAFPQRFPSWQDALGRVTDWSAKLKAPAISASATV